MASLFLKESTATAIMASLFSKESTATATELSLASTEVYLFVCLKALRHNTCFKGPGAQCSSR